MANTVEINVKAKDSASRVLSGMGKAVKGLRKNILDALKPVGEMALKIASIGSTAASAAPLLLPAVKAVAGVGQAALQASPALLSFAVAGGFVFVTLKKIFGEGSAAREALSPLAKAFNDAGEAASRAAAKGVKPLAEQFSKLNFPAIREAMVRIGDATGKVTRGFLRWANTAEGVKAIKGIVDPIGRSMQQLAPHITRVTISFTAMLGRITGVSMAAGTKGLAGALDKLAGVMDRVDKTSVGGGLAKLGDAARTVRRWVSIATEWIGRAIDFYKKHEVAFKRLSDAIAVAAIAFGGPMTVVVAVIGLVIRHFDDLKKAYESVKGYFKSPIGKGVLDDLRDAAETIMPKIKDAFQEIKEDVLPPLRDLGKTLKEDLGPSFAKFAKDAAPIVAWLIEHLGKDFGNKLAGTITILDGLATSLSGFFEVLSGFLEGDSGKILRGLGKEFEGLGKVAKGALRAISGENWDKLVELAGKAKHAVTDFKNEISGLKSKTVHIAQSGAGKARDAVSGLIDRIHRLAGKIVSVGERGAAAAKRRVDQLIGIIRRVRGKVVSVGANVFGLGAVRGLINTISRVTSKVVNVGANIFGFAHGGVVGAAAGGPRSNLTLVGEQGPELIRLPAGATVTPNGQTRQMLDAASRPVAVLLEWGNGPTDPLARAIWDWLKKNIRLEGGGGDGNVQRALG